MKSYKQFQQSFFAAIAKAAEQIANKKSQDGTVYKGSSTFNHARLTWGDNEWLNAAYLALGEEKSNVNESLWFLDYDKKPVTRQYADDDPKKLAQRLADIALGVWPPKVKWSSLREEVIKLAHKNPELRQDLLPLLKKK